MHETASAAYYQLLLHNRSVEFNTVDDSNCNCAEEVAFPLKNHSMLLFQKVLHHVVLNIS
jgi:hypothetical protein